MKKLWYSFTKELQLASKSFYFYLEIGMAALLLALLLLVIPDTFTSKMTEFVYLDVPEQVESRLIDAIIEEDLDGKAEEKELKVFGEKETFDYYESDDKKIYIIDSEEKLIELAEKERKFGAVISFADNKLQYDYYMQGYESDKLKNLYKVFHNTDTDMALEHFDKQEVIKLSDGFEGLSDRENILPSFLTFNGSLMGFFIIAAYVFLDKKEGLITAYAVTAAPVRYYLLSKVGVIMTTSIFTSLLMVIPIMGLQPNYLMFIVFLLCSGFFASVAGLVLTSYYDNIMQAFGTIYGFMMLMILPNISYFMPSWDPVWMKFIPSYYFLQSFKEVLLPNGDMMYVLMTSGAFLGIGLLLLAFAGHRFKKTLSL